MILSLLFLQWVKQRMNYHNLAYGLAESPSKREMDMLLSNGEQVTMALLSIKLNAIGDRCHFSNRCSGRSHN